MERDYAALADQLVEWIRERVRLSQCKGIVVGLSGGVDSSTVAMLSKRAFPDDCLGVAMPCYSDPLDLEHAVLLADRACLEMRIVILDDVFDRLLEAMGEIGPKVTRQMACANMKPRLRMTTLYYHANRLGYLVAGTGNKSEAIVGYFTKYGDGGVDILPLGNLVKTEVYGLAKYLGVPEQIIQKPPSAGLWADQTDEVEMGLAYQELDEYIKTGKASDETKKRITEMNAASEHKRKLPLVPPF